MSAETLRAALAASLASLTTSVRSYEQVDALWIRRGARLPLGVRQNPAILEFAALVAAVVEEHPDWCSDCAYSQAYCGHCHSAFWRTDWEAVRVTAFDAEAEYLGISMRSRGDLRVPTVDFFGPRSPHEEYDVLLEYVSWAQQDWAQGRDPDGGGWTKAEAAASAFWEKYSSRL